ncbi:MAG: MFS transporter [Candidatus Gracilibacteria bacterium]|nr:MFS transporter [Candidatus Gracilibacteria bacterium]
MTEQYPSYQRNFFFYLLSQRRNFIPILSIYFLTLGDTNAAQIGIFMGIGHLASLLLEVPSAFFADRFGHKKTLILSKTLQILSVTMFLGAYFISAPGNFYVFIIAAILQSVGFSFFSGTTAAYYHELLEQEGNGKDFGKRMSQLRGKVSLLSAAIIITLPFLVQFHITFPLVVNLLFDIGGLFVLFLLPNVSNNHHVGSNKKSIFVILSEVKKSGVLYISIFMGVIVGFLIGENPFRAIYLESLGFPIILIGTVMGFSRVVWFLVGHYAHYLEHYLSLRRLLFLELLLFPIVFLAVAHLTNPYLIGFIFIIIIGYQHGRKAILQGFILNDFGIDKRYKATTLSIESFVNSFSGMMVTFGIGFIMSYSYRLGYTILGILLFFLLSFIFYLIYKKRS